MVNNAYNKIIKVINQKVKKNCSNENLAALILETKNQKQLLNNYPHTIEVPNFCKQTFVDKVKQVYVRDS